MSQYCRFCGSPIEAAGRFCSACGRSVEAGSNRRSAILLTFAGLLVGAGVVSATVLSFDTDEEPAAAAPTPSTSTTAAPTTTAGETLSATSAPEATAPPTTAEVELDSAELARRFGDAVWKVEVAGCGVTAYGSGFAISPNHVVTNQHVVEVDSTPTPSPELVVPGHDRDVLRRFDPVPGQESLTVRLA